MSRAVSELTEYAVRKGWIEKEDRVYISNLILDAIGEQSFEGLEEIEGDLRDIHLILQDLCDIAYNNGIVDGNSAAYYDLLDTKLIGLLPSLLIFVFIWVKVIEKSSWRSTLIVVALMAVIGYGLFQGILNVPFPNGLIYDTLFY